MAERGAAEDIAVESLREQVKIQTAILLDPRIVDESIPDLRLANDTELIIQRRRVATRSHVALERSGASDLLEVIQRGVEFLETQRSEILQIDILREPSIGLTSATISGPGRGRSVHETLAANVHVRGVMEHMSPVEGLSIHANLLVQIFTTRSDLVPDEILKGRKEVEVRGHKPMAVELRISRTFLDVHDIRSRRLLQKRRKRLLTEDRSRLNTNFAHRIADVRSPRNGFEKFRPSFPCLLPLAGGLDEVVWEFIVVVNIILRPRGADVVVQRRKCETNRHKQSELIGE